MFVDKQLPQTIPVLAMAWHSKYFRSLLAPMPIITASAGFATIRPTVVNKMLAAGLCSAYNHFFRVRCSLSSLNVNVLSDTNVTI